MELKAMASPRGKRFQALMVIFVLTILVAGASYGQQRAKLKVGIVAVADVVSLFIGMDKGFFAQEGLEIEPVPMAGGAVILPAIAGRSLQLGYTQILAPVLSWAQGFDFVMVPPAVYVGTDAVMGLAKDAEIFRPRDLEGKKVGTNTLKQIGWLYIRELVARDGGDPEKINWVEIPFPNILPALANRQIEAAPLPEPLVTMAKATPQVRLGLAHLNMVNPGGVLGVWVASKRWIDRERDLAIRFVRPHRKAVDYANARPEEARALLPKFTRLAPDMVAKIMLPSLRNDLDVANIQWTIDLMVRHGLLKQRLEAKELVYELGP